MSIRSDRRPTLTEPTTNEVVALMRSVRSEDWSRKAANVEWTCRYTVEHIISDLVHYAGQLIGQAQDDYFRFSFDTARAETNDQLIDVVELGGRMLALAIATAPSESRAWHPQGMFDPAGWDAMGSAEALVHTYDLALGLGLAWLPPDHIAAPIVRRAFPESPTGPPASSVLLWSTGRLDLDGHPHVGRWRYYAG